MASKRKRPATMREINGKSTIEHPIIGALLSGVTKLFTETRTSPVMACTALRTWLWISENPNQSDLAVRKQAEIFWRQETERLSAQAAKAGKG